ILSFLALLGQVEKQGRIACELLKAGLSVAIRVQRRFQTTKRHWAPTQDLAAPPYGFCFEFSEGNDRVDESHLQSLLCVVLATQKPDLTRLLLTHDTREI